MFKVEGGGAKCNDKRLRCIRFQNKTHLSIPFLCLREPKVGVQSVVRNRCVRSRKGRDHPSSCLPGVPGKVYVTKVQVTKVTTDSNVCALSTGFFFQ